MVEAVEASLQTFYILLSTGILWGGATASTFPPTFFLLSKIIMNDNEK
jgi:hypothetical protein